MPQFATSNRASLRYIPETTFGTTPTLSNTVQYQELRYTGETLNYGATFEPSQEIRADRMTPDTVLVGRTSEGEINGELSYGTYDDLIENVLYDVWTTGASAVTGTDIAITRTGNSAKLCI